MALTADQKAERARQRMLETAKAYSSTTYCRHFVASVFQRMIRAEAGAHSLPFGFAIVEGELKDVERAVGNVVCITCGTVKKWDGRDIHTGHFLASRRNSILFDEDNVAPQCAHCNAYRSGMPLEYRKWMLEIRGLETVERLERLKTQSVSFGLEELVDMRLQYAARLKAAEERMKDARP